MKKIVLKRIARVLLLFVVAGTVLSTTACNGDVYMGVSVSSPYGYGYPYGGGYGVGVYGRPYHW